MSAQSDRGTLIIPDITGYTEFLSSVEIEHGQHIIAELLDGIIKGNQLGLTLSEIEGDALLFYRMGSPPALEDIMAQARRWLEDFHLRLQRMTRDIYCSCGACQYLGNLSLKIVVHYGSMGRFRIEGHEKLIGKDVVLAHRLLKNTLNLREYLLVSNGALEAMGVSECGDQGLRPARETYPVFGEIGLGFLDLSPVKANLPPLEEIRVSLPVTDDYMVNEITISAPMARAVWAVSDLEASKLWISGLRGIVYDHREPLGRGQHHVCILEGQELEHWVETVQETPNEFLISFRIKPPRLFLRSLYKTIILIRTDQGIRVRQFTYYSRMPLLGRVFEKFFFPRIREGIERSLENLKQLLEEETSAESSVA